MLSVIIGVILASAFPAIVVYAQGLIPGRVGMVAGLFFGVAFGIAGIGAAVLGWLADQTSIVFVYHVCAFLPAIGLLAAFLPETGKAKVLRKTKRRLRFGRQNSAYVLLLHERHICTGTCVRPFRQGLTASTLGLASYATASRNSLRHMRGGGHA